MTTQSLARPQAAARRGSRLGALLQAWIERDSQRRQLHALALLDDRLLRDVGVTRADLRDLGL